MFNEQLFRQACTIQADAFTEPSEFGIECNRTVFRAATNAANDGETDCKPHIVNSGTGTGKTTFCISLIAACTSALPEYSAAYIVGTIKEAQRVYTDLARLLPNNSVALHSSAHKDELAASAISEDVLDHFREFGPTSILDLPKHPIIVCTHEMWAREGVLGADYGIRSYNGRRRTHVFIDEFPNTITTQEFGPSEFDALADEVERMPHQAVAAKAIRSAASRLREQCGANGRDFDVANLVPVQDRALISQVDLSPLGDARDLEKSRSALAGLLANADGRSFLWRSPRSKSNDIAGHKTLVTYSDSFRPHPGLIILDATADFLPRTQDDGLWRRYGSPAVDYRNLSIVHVQQPDEFKNISRKSASAELIREYTQWIKAAVRENTSAGEKVLLVAPKKVIEALGTQQIAPGRTVECIHWGKGIGTNAYRDCSTVFQFSEFHLPRRAYVSLHLASQDTRASEADLRQANGAYPGGRLSREIEGHRLRWFKQMGCRGSIRAVAGNGVARPMRLFTTMGMTLLLDNYQSVFPMSGQPKFMAQEPTSAAMKGKRLAHLLTMQMNNRQQIVLSACEIKKRTGIVSKDIKRVFNGRVCRPFGMQGWGFVAGAGRSSKPSLRYDDPGLAANLLLREFNRRGNTALQLRQPPADVEA